MPKWERKRLALAAACLHYRTHARQDVYPSNPKLGEKGDHPRLLGLYPLRPLSRPACAGIVFRMTSPLQSQSGREVRANGDLLALQVPSPDRKSTLPIPNWERKGINPWLLGLYPLQPLLLPASQEFCTDSAALSHSQLASGELARLNFSVFYCEFVAL